VLSVEPALLVPRPLLPTSHTGSRASQASHDLWAQTDEVLISPGRAHQGDAKGHLTAMGVPPFPRRVGMPIAARSSTFTKCDQAPSSAGRCGRGDTLIDVREGEMALRSTGPRARRGGDYATAVRPGDASKRWTAKMS
jgi:hypothetical protein